VTTDECPHGLEPEWCSLCKAAVAKAIAREQAKIDLANRPVGRAPASPRSPRAPRVARPRVEREDRAPVPVDPALALSGVRPLVFHAAAYGAWPSIAEYGLRTPEQLAPGHPALLRVREEMLEVPRPGDVGEGPVEIRDQRPLARADIAAHLDGIDLAGWLALVNERVYLFAGQNELTTHLARYQAQGEDVIVFDTARLLKAARGRVEVACVASGAPTQWGNCPCRGRSTFIPLPRYEGAAADIKEVTVVGGLESVTDLVTRVVRHHPDRSTEVLVGRR
jgi:hypothetical protein